MSTRERDNRRLLRRIREYHTASDSVMGMPRMHEVLTHEGETASRNRIARLMARNGLYGIPQRRQWRRKRSGTRPAYVRNHLERDFTATEPNTKWVTDITYIHTAGGWLYLCVVVDLYGGKVVGWSMSTTQDRQLILRAVLMACWQRPNRQPVILHSDRGTQGGFKRSSQHLKKEEELRWRQASADGRIELYVRRCVHPVVPRWDAGSIGRGSGRKSLEGCRARSRRWQPACLPLLARAGFANVVACHLSVFVLCRGATYRSSSEKRLRFFMLAVAACARSPGSWAAHRRRSRENCGGTQQHEVETSSIEPQPPNGMPIDERDVRKLPNSLQTAN